MYQAGVLTCPARKVFANPAAPSTSESDASFPSGSVQLFLFTLLFFVSHLISHLVGNDGAFFSSIAVVCSPLLLAI